MLRRQKRHKSSQESGNPGGSEPRHICEGYGRGGREGSPSCASGTLKPLASAAGIVTLVKGRAGQGEEGIRQSAGEAMQPRNPIRGRAGGRQQLATPDPPLTDTGLD